MEEMMRLLPFVFACGIMGLGTLAASATTISDVIVSGNLSDPTITIDGSGFGTAPAPVLTASPGYTGSDYGPTALWFDDLGPQGFQAGRSATTGHDTIGLVISSYTDTQIVLTLGSEYSEFFYPDDIYRINPGDPYYVEVNGVTNLTPEPSTLLLLASGVLLPVAARFRRRNT